MYERTIAAVMRSPWAILPEKLEAIQEVLSFRASGQRWGPDEIAANLAMIGVTAPKQACDYCDYDSAPPAAAPFIAIPASTPKSPGLVAVIPIQGIIQNRASEMGESSGVMGVNTLSRRFRMAVDDPAVKAVVLDVDSPGGSVYAVPEFADQIMAARASKPIVAVANQLAASAAFWIATAAEEFYVSPSGEAGSVGVYTAHVDRSKRMETEGDRVTLISAGKYKVEGNPYEPLGDEARAQIQSEVDRYYGMFVGALAKQRGVSEAKVRGDFGQGRLLGAKEAVAAGMADGVKTLDQVLAKLGAGPGGARQPSGSRASASGSRAMRELELLR